MNTSFSQKFSALCQNGVSLSEAIEKGQSEMPLTQHFKSLLEESRQLPFSMILLGLTPEARSHALGWFYGKEYSVLSVEVIEKLGLVEIFLCDKGFILEHGTQKSLTFDALEAFLSAAKADNMFDALNAIEIEKPARIGVVAKTPLKGVRLLVPHNTELLLKNPALLSSLVTRANTLVVAATPDYQLSQNDKMAIDELLESTDAFWPLLTIDELADNTSLPNHGWWEQFSQVTVQIPPKLLTTHVAAEMPELLKNTHEVTRQNLFNALQYIRLKDATEALNERFENESRILNNRVKREARKSTGSNEEHDEQEMRLQWERLKTELSDEIQQLNRDLQKPRTVSNATKTTGNVNVEQFLESLSFDDLDKDEGYKTVKLSIKESFQNALIDVIYNSFSKDADALISQTEKRMELMLRKLKEEMNKLVSHRVELELPVLDLKDLLDRNQQILNLHIRYRGEMQKRGFWHRLSEGRRAMFGILMFSTVGGMALGLDLRSGRFFGFVLAMTMIGSILYTFISWKKEDSEKLDKELDRVKEGVGSEAKRISSELQRDLHKQLGYYLQDIQKQFSRKFDTLFRTTFDALKREQTEQYASTKERIRKLESQMRELEQKGREVQRLINDVNRLNHALK